MENKQKCAVVISQSPVKTVERLDFQGNTIDPRTKRVILPKEKEFIPPVSPVTPPAPPPQPPVTPVTSPVPQDEPIDIQTAIQQAEAKVTELKEAKKSKIKEMEAELNNLKKQ